MNSPSIYIKDRNSGQVLATFLVTEMSLAFEQAKEYEEFGLEIELITPTVLEGLAECLGLDDTNKNQLMESVDSELVDHDSSCCKN